MINFKEISPLGGGLKILINSDYTVSHNWMCFSSWYSINQNLPDAKVQINCKRNVCDYQIFNWPNRCGVDFSFNKNYDENEWFIITPETMAVSTLNVDAIGPIDCKSNELSTFVNFKNGCGFFDFNKHNSQCPFSYTTKLYSEDLSLNEYRILKLWDKANMPYISTA